METYLNSVFSYSNCMIHMYNFLLWEPRSFRGLSLSHVRQSPSPQSLHLQGLTGYSGTPKQDMEKRTQQVGSNIVLVNHTHIGMQYIYIYVYLYVYIYIYLFIYLFIVYIYIYTMVQSKKTKKNIHTHIHT